MQTVPSLVGTGTAIAAAASGLVFGQPPPANAAAQDTPTRRLRRHLRTIYVDRALDANRRPPSFVDARPLTTSAAPSVVDDDLRHRTVSHPRAASRPPLSRHQRPRSSQFTNPRSFSRKLSSATPGDSLPSAAPAGPRDSLVSNGSWMRRLSIRSPSRSDSSRSSLIGDTTSTDFSYYSTTTIPPRPSPTAPFLPPNKLVKRNSSGQDAAAPTEISPRWRSRGYLPTLRRPSTSHYRSAILQQFRADVNVAGSTARAKYSFEQPIGPEELLGASPFDEHVFAGSQLESGWGSFFHLKATHIASSGSLQSRVGDATPPPRVQAAIRICPHGSNSGNRVHLVKPKMISPSSTPVDVSLASPALNSETSCQPSGQASGATTAFLERVPPTRARRSLSESLSSATGWVSRRSGSLRRPKRGLDQSDTVTRRHVSEPTERITSPSPEGQQKTTSPPGQLIDTAAPPKVLQEPALITSATTARRQLPAHHRNESSPPSGQPIVVYGVGSLPRPMGFSRGAVARHGRPNQPSGSSTSSAALSQFGRGSHYERSSVVESSDGDARGFTSGDDDDFDFKSDTMFDSVRTISSCRARAVETPLESVYDESPPSTAGNGRTKRLSVQEMLARGWDEENKILEEDESASTPVRSGQYTGIKHSPTRGEPIIVEPHSSSESPHDDAARLTEELKRSSVDGFDDDEDWTRDVDEPLDSHLTAPFKGGSPLSAKGMNPNVRLALASIEGDTLPRAGHHSHHLDRPLSNLFEWSETMPHDKHEGGGMSMRPRTAYAMPERDSRGGRSAMRRGPTPTHVRSQSVPIVHDSLAAAKPPGPKYGTWGMGAKTVSEDWDEDFEFGLGGADCNGDGADKSAGDSFAVPEAIRATQPSVRAHSGQIRELSLLVNDLKRLCRHGRELNMLHGDQRGLWKEAEGIIALASPDEDDDEEKQHSSPPNEASCRDTKDPSLDRRFDAATADQSDGAFDSPEPVMRKDAVVRERQSPRRRSVFSPDDDIFGANWPLVDPNGASSGRVKQPRTPDSRTSPPSDVSIVVRSVVESVRQQHRASTEPLREQRPPDGGSARVQFDTNSLKALVRRAGELRDVLSDAIRRADQITQSPAVTPRRERRLESSPAFTRVFDDPGSSPLRRTTKSRDTSSVMENTPSSEKSPSSPIGSQMPLMTVG